MTTRMSFSDTTPRYHHLGLVAAISAMILGGLYGGQNAEAAPPHRSWYDLPSSNGYGAVVVDLQQGRAHHLRDHLFATEEPRWDASGDEVWTNNHPEVVWSRDLLYDAFFGLSVDGASSWLTSHPVDLDASGYVGLSDAGPAGGTNLLHIVQQVGDLYVERILWAPWGIERSAMAMLLRVRNDGAAAHDVKAYSLHNLHLGEGRPGPTQDIGTENETIVVHADGLVEERGFAGVIALRPITTPSHIQGYSATSGGDNPWAIVDSGSGELGDSSGDLGSAEDSVSALQWTHGTLNPGQSAWSGLVLAHHGDPFAVDTLRAELDSWLSGRSPEQILADERAQWQTFQNSLDVPPNLSTDELNLYHHAAVVLRMAQVREQSTWLREWLTTDGEPRYSMFNSSLPGEVQHNAAGGVLASLPPGEWTYAWPRDGAYAIVGMSLAGMHTEAREALRYMLDAVSDRYRTYNELSAYPITPYAISLCRHHGFGVEESDTSGGGDFNFEFDGAGLWLWAMGEYIRASGDWTLLEDRWATVRDEVANFLVPLIDHNDLIMKDSSIWEHHWMGGERSWAYTSITAARGLCDAALFADHQGEAAQAQIWRDAANDLRDGLLTNLADADGAIAQTLEELQAGYGYTDAATNEVASMSLFDPNGTTTPATMDLIQQDLRTPGGLGFARNDDAWANGHGLSPWGGPYDSAEWVFIDLRMAVGLRETGQTGASDVLIDWITDQSTLNYLAIGETYDPNTADYTNNAPMVGFGSGAYIIAINHREGGYEVEPACGFWPSEGTGDDDTGDDDDDDTGDDDDDTGDDDDDDTGDDDTGDDDDTIAVSPVPGCSCESSVAASSTPWWLALLVPVAARRRR